MQMSKANVRGACRCAQWMIRIVTTTMKKVEIGVGKNDDENDDDKDKWGGLAKEDICLCFQTEEGGPGAYI